MTYEKTKKIIAEKNIKTKEKYFELCEKDIRLPKEPDEVFKTQFKGWIDFLGIVRGVYYDLDTCIKKVDEYLCIYPELKKNLKISIIIDELCKKDAMFPPNGLWEEYYSVKDLQNIITITHKKKKKISDIF